jgi:hypothetical protein
MLAMCRFLQCVVLEVTSRQAGERPEIKHFPHDPRTFAHTMASAQTGTWHGAGLGREPELDGFPTLQ